jgi:hypothetical protein
MSPRIKPHRPVVSVPPAPDRERRGDKRRPGSGRATLTVLDLLGGSLGSAEVLTRDQSSLGLSFLFKKPLTIGQTCRLDLPPDAGPAKSYMCEVVRARPVSNGRYEMAVQFRKKI